jgi:Flp pilus assembly protein TadG
MAQGTDHERGASIVEFALVAPLLFTLLLGILQVSLLENRQQGLHAAAREGARLGSLDGVTDSEIEDHVEVALDGVGFETVPQITVESCGSGSDPDVVTVTITADSTSFVPFISGTITQTGEGAFRCES